MMPLHLTRRCPFLKTVVLLRIRSRKRRSSCIIFLERAEIRLWGMRQKVGSLLDHLSLSLSSLWCLRELKAQKTCRAGDTLSERRTKSELINWQMWRRILDIRVSLTSEVIGARFPSDILSKSKLHSSFSSRNLSSCLVVSGILRWNYYIFGNDKRPAWHLRGMHILIVFVLLLSTLSLMSFCISIKTTDEVWDANGLLQKKNGKRYSEA